VITARSNDICWRRLKKAVDVIVRRDHTGADI
jgi:hypothetical protein